MTFSAVALQKTKNAIHGVQGLFIFIAWAVMIGVFTRDGNSDGRSKYYFVLVSLVPRVRHDVS